jgi:hypothetical protein
MYKIFVAVSLFLLSITLPAKAQNLAPQGPSASELPNKPEIRVPRDAELHLDNCASKRSFKVADKKFWVLAGLQVGATFADFETTQWAQRVRPDGSELNPLYGRHPGRPRMYSIGMSLTTLQIFVQYKSRARAHETGKLKKAWIAGALVNTGVHTLLAVHNGQIAGQGADCVSNACR